MCQTLNEQLTYFTLLFVGNVAQDKGNQQVPADYSNVEIATSLFLVQFIIRVGLFVEMKQNLRYNGNWSQNKNSDFEIVVNRC